MNDLRKALDHARATLMRCNRGEDHEGDEESGEHFIECLKCEIQGAVAHIDAALAAPSDRDSIRREAFEEAAAIVESGADRVNEVTRMALLARASRIRALAAPAKEATVDDSRCPDCNRPKARDVHDAATMIGYPSRGVFCPKWWAIRDPEADRDCERHAATKGGADGR